jgi:hypothetical protein
MRQARSSATCVLLALVATFGACGGGSSHREGGAADAPAGASGTADGGSGNGGAGSGGSGAGAGNDGAGGVDAGPSNADAPKDIAADTPSALEGGAGADGARRDADDGPPAMPNVCGAAGDATPAGTATRTTKGDTTNARNNAALSLATSAPACRINLKTDVDPLVGHDVAYSVVVPSRKRLTATVRPDLDWQPALWLARDCAALEASCVVLSATRTPGATEALSWTNNAPTPKTVYLVIDSAGSSGTFSLETSLADTDPTPANDTCAGAIPLSLPMGFMRVQGTTEGATDDEHPAANALPPVCRDLMDGWVGADVVYSVLVPAGLRLYVSASGLPPLPPKHQIWNPALWLSESCTDVSTCLAAQDDDEEIQGLPWTNQSATDKTVFIHVDARDPSNGTLLLSAIVDRTDYVPGDVCPGVARDPNITWIGTTTMMVNDDSFGPSTVSAACRAAVQRPWLGKDSVSSFVVPSGKTFAANVLSTATTNQWQLLLSTTCGTMLESGAACVAAGQSVSWKNVGATAQTVYLFVDSESATNPTANYQVTTSLK